jgi:nicotinic acid mononucleotide adenylyltransferase
MEILAHARLAVLRRPGAPVELAEVEAALPGVSRRVDLIDAPRLDISAHAIRQRVAGGLPLDGLVPPAVAALIVERGLYR